MWFSGLPAGVQVSSASGFDYTVKPQEPVLAMPPVAPVLSAHWLAAGSQVELCWNSQTNVNYQPQFLTVLDVNNSNWMNFGPPIVGNGSTNCVTDAVIPAQVERVYRVLTFP